MFKKLSKKTEGFTIIEVLIVLAIAGLILLIVFLAVPALQRNSRNTRRKTDVSGMLAGVSEYLSNNNGGLPGAVSASGSTLTLKKDAVASSGTDVALGFYDPSSVSVDADGTATNQNDAEKVTIVMKGKCSGSDAVPGSTREVVLLYSVESGSSSKTQICQAG